MKYPNSCKAFRIVNPLCTDSDAILAGSMECLLIVIYSLNKVVPGRNRGSEFKYIFETNFLVVFNLILLVTNLGFFLIEY